MRLLRALAALVLPVAVLVGGVAAVLLVVADTWVGHALGAGFLLVSVGGLFLPLALAPGGDPPDYTDEALVVFEAWKLRERRRRIAIVGPMLGVGLALLALAWAVAPSAVIAPLHDGPGLQSVWLGPAAPSRFGLAWVTPERDQMALASYLMGLVDPYFDQDQAARLRPAVRTIYDEAEQDPSYRRGSVLGLAYTELLGGPGLTGQIYVDLAPEAGKQPALLFIHGFGGSPISYSWVLRKVAHAHGYALVAPSYGAGLWYQDEGVGVIDRTLEWMASTGRFDMDRVVLAGLSNGGFGVTAVAGRHPWRGVAWLSGVLVPEDAARLSLTVPVLVLHGRDDDRIDLPWIERGVTDLRANGATVDFDVVDGADHFLLFTHRDRADAAIDRWLSAVGG